MRKYNTYFAISGFLLISVFFIGLLTLLFLGVFQLSVGVYLLNKYKSYPQWARKGIRFYWGISIGYFIVLLLGFVLTSLAEPFIVLWLIIVPLLIAGYQFRLVWMMSGLRRRQLEKRAFLKIYSH